MGNNPTSPRLRRARKIVVIGGGTGSSIVLKALKNSGHKLYALVPMGDSGGSTGRIRDEFGVLSTGEIRQRLIAMASEDEKTQLLASLLEHRFENGQGLKGHNFGNLMICALTEKYGSQKIAIEAMSKLLKINGEIVPSTFDRFDLAAEYANGSKLIGEHFIDESDSEEKIIRLYAEAAANANPRAVEVIKKADVLIFTMGDLYTSVLHSIIVRGIAEAISKSKSKKIYIGNLMTSRGETSGMTLGDHVAELEKYINSEIDAVLLNSKKIPGKILNEHKKMSESPVRPELNGEQKKRIKIISADLISNEKYEKSGSDILKRSTLRHDHKKLGKVLEKIIKHA